MTGNKDLWRAMTVLLITTLFLTSCTKKIEKNNKILTTTNHLINLEKDEVVICTFFKEVMRKEEISRIDLIGTNLKAPYYYNLILQIDGVRHKLDEEMRGYKPELLVSDINHDSLIDFLVTIKSGNTDNSILYGLYTFQNRVFTPIHSFDQKNGIVPLQFKWSSLDTIQVQSQIFQINTKKHLSKLDASYANSLIGITGYLSLEVIDYNQDFQNELIGLQLIWLKYPYNGIFKFKTVLKYMEGKWKLLEYGFLSVS